jgi:hypothetical protein
MVLGPGPSAVASGRTHRLNSPGFAAGPIDDELGAAVAVSGSTAVIGAQDVNNSAGAAYIYTRKGGAWSLARILTDPSNGPGDFFGRAVAISGRYVIIGTPGKVYVYVGSGSQWKLQVTLTGPRKENFGSSVAVQGSTAIVGAIGNNQGPGVAYVYVRSGTRWQRRATLTEPDPHNGDQFGWSAALAGGTLVIGASGWQDDEGIAYVFAGSGATWQLQSTLTDPRGQAQDSYGWSVAVSGDIIAVGTAGTAGGAYIYERSGTTWPLADTPTGPDKGTSEGFGWSVAVSGTMVMVGAWQVNDNGAVYVYSQSGTTWSQQAIVDDPNPPLSFDNFGIAIVAAGSTMMVGAPSANNGAGTAFAYVQSHGRWTRQSALTDPRGRRASFEGAAVAISGSLAVVGAWGANDLAGAVYVYHRSPRGVWQLQIKLTDPGRSYLDLFGTSVAVSGSSVIVGAPGENYPNGAVYIYGHSGGQWERAGTLPGRKGEFLGSAVAADGSTIVAGADDALNFAGAANVYVRSAHGWHQQAVIDSPDRGCVCGFGSAIALSGNLVVLGAPGVGSYDGSAYIYVRSGTRWHPRAALPDPRRVPNDTFGTSVAISGATAIIGAPGARDSAGAAYVYDQFGTRWRQRTTLTVKRTADPAGGFGGAVALTGAGSGIEALISGLSVSGLVATKTQCGSAFAYIASAGRWHERERIADPRCLSYDEFGYALALAGQTALIGAPGAHGDSGAAYLLTLLKP